MINLLRYLIFMKRVMNNEFCLNDEEAAKVLGCAISTLPNIKCDGGLIMNVDYIETFGRGFFYRRKSLLKRLAIKSRAAQKK